jgi:hypothetical protein
MEQRLRLVQGGHGRGERRSAERAILAIPGQIVWKDAHGKTQMANVVTRDISENGVSIECRVNASLPLYRLVYFQVDRNARNRPDLPAVLRRQTVLSAVFRVGASSEVTGRPVDYGLRLLVEPKPAAATEKTQWQATPAATRSA